MTGILIKEGPSCGDMERRPRVTKAEIGATRPPAEECQRTDGSPSLWRRPCPARPLPPGFAPRTCKTRSSAKSPRVWYFVTAAPGDNRGEKEGKWRKVQGSAVENHTTRRSGGAEERGGRRGGGGPCSLAAGGTRRVAGRLAPPASSSVKWDNSPHAPGFEEPMC